MPALRQAIADHLSREKGVAVDPEREICVTVGAMEALLAGILTVVDRGDEVILPSPNYASHIEQVLLAEGTPVFVPLPGNRLATGSGCHPPGDHPRNAGDHRVQPAQPHRGAVFRSHLRAVAELAIGPRSGRDLR